MQPSRTFACGHGAKVSQMFLHNNQAQSMFRADVVVLTTAEDVTSGEGACVALMAKYSDHDSLQKRVTKPCRAASTRGE